MATATQVPVQGTPYLRTVSRQVYSGTDATGKSVCPRGYRFLAVGRAAQVAGSATYGCYDKDYMDITRCGRKAVRYIDPKTGDLLCANKKTLYKQFPDAKPQSSRIRIKKEEEPLPDLLFDPTKM